MSKGIASYITYSGVGAANGIMNTQAPKPLTELESNAGAINMQTIDNLPWLFDMFPDAVADGTLKLVNGSIFVSGVALIDIVTLSISIISVLILVLKSLGDLKMLVVNNKLSSMEAEIKELEKKKLEAELALINAKA